MTWKTGQSGNPSGRRRGLTPRGEFRRQVDSALPEIVARLVEAAKAGDIAATKLILDRVLPPLRATDEYIALELPDSQTERGEAVLRALVAQELTPTQAAIVIQVLDGARMLAENEDLSQRLQVIETWLRNSGG